MHANELRRRAAELLSQAAQVLESVEADDAVPSDELNQRHDALVAQAEGLAARAEQLEAMEARRAAVAAGMERSGGPSPAPAAAHNDPRNTRGGRHKFDVTRAVRAQMAGGVPDGLEGEVHSDLARFRSNTKGVLVPLDVEVSYRAYSAAGATSTVVRGPIQEALMSRLVLARAGVQQIVGSGIFKLPTATSGSVYWVTNASPTGADRSIGQLAFEAHTIAGKTKVDRQTLTSSPFDHQTYIWDQLLRDIAVGYQAGCFHGTNADGQPKGLFTHTSGDGVTVKALGATGAALTYANLVEMVGAVETADAGDGVAWITNPSVTSKLEGTVKVSGQDSFCYNPASKAIIDRPVFATSSVSKTLSKSSSGNVLSAIAVGDWNRAVMAMFSAIDVFVNPFNDDGGTTLSAFLDCDFGLVRPAAFAIAVDVSTA